MADLGMDYNPDEVEPGSFDGELIPSGTRAPMQITSSEVIPNKAGTGRMLKLRWDVTEGPFTNRVVFEQINYQHSSAQAQTIGQQQLKSICDAVGHVGPLTDSEMLHYRPCMCTIGIEKGKPKSDGSGNYEDRNKITSHKPLTAGSAPAAKPATAAPATAKPQATAAKPAAAAGNRPWPSRAA